MSGVQGPLETRASTQAVTPADLSLLDATPWTTGELAIVTSLSVPGTPALFALDREDNVSVINGTTVLAVGPASAGQGRWLRMNIVFGPPVPPPGGAGPMILEGWFVGIGEGEVIVDGGVGINTPVTEMDRFSAPLTGVAPLNQYPILGFVASVPGTVTELQIVPSTPMGPTVGQSVTGQLTLNGVLTGPVATLNSVNQDRAVVVEAVPYVAGDVLGVSYSSVNNVINQRTGLIAQLRVQE